MKMPPTLEDLQRQLFQLQIEREEHRKREAKADADRAEMMRDVTKHCIEKEIGMPKWPGSGSS